MPKAFEDVYHFNHVDAHVEKLKDRLSTAKYLVDNLDTIGKLVKGTAWSVRAIYDMIGCGEKVAYKLVEGSEKKVTGLLIMATNDMPKGPMLCYEWLTYGGKLPFEDLAEMCDTIAIYSGYTFTSAFVRPGITKKYGKTLKKLGYTTRKHLYIKTTGRY